MPRHGDVVGKRPAMVKRPSKAPSPSGCKNVPQFTNPVDPVISLSSHLKDSAGAATSKQVRENLQRLGGIPLVGFCSGANMQTAQAKLVTQMFKAGSVHDLVVCEMEEEKLQFAEFIASECGSQTRHCACKDMTKLRYSMDGGSGGEVEGDCAVHGQPCRLPCKPPALIGSCGYSCTNFSKQFNQSGGETRAEVLQSVFTERKGASGETGGAMQDIGNSIRYKFNFWENSPEKLSDSNRGQYAEFEAESYRNGYSNHGAIFNLCDFGTCNMRVRACGVQVEFRDSAMTYTVGKALAHNRL